MRLNKCLLLIVLMFFASCGNPDYDQEKSDWIDTLDEISEANMKDVPDDSPYGFETGVIEYESSTMGMKQQVITMFCKFGMISSTEIKTKMLGQSVNQLTLVNDTAIFTINMIDNSGSYALLDSTETELNFRNLSEADISQNNIKVGDKEEILGKQCTIYELVVEKKNVEIKNWIWEGITLKSVSSMGGIKVTMVAKKLRVNVQIPSENFEVPHGFSVHKTASDSLFVQ